VSESYSPAEDGVRVLASAVGVDVERNEWRWRRDCESDRVGFRGWETERVRRFELLRELPIRISMAFSNASGPGVGGRDLFSRDED